MFIYTMLHTWGATPDEQRGLVVYLRSLEPMAQGEFDFRSIRRGGSGAGGSGAGGSSVGGSGAGGSSAGGSSAGGSSAGGSSAGGSGGAGGT
jgi:hypothetical protein